MSTTDTCQAPATIEQHEETIRTYLRHHSEVVSKAQLRAGTDVPAWYINQIASQDTFYTSLNHNSKYVASKHIIGHRSTHDGFWRPAVDDGCAVFHRKETTIPSNTSHSTALPDLPPPKLTTFSTDAVTALSRHSPINRKFTRLTGKRPPFTPIAGRPDGTPS